MNAMKQNLLLIFLTLGIPIATERTSAGGTVKRVPAGATNALSLESVLDEVLRRNPTLKAARDRPEVRLDGLRPVGRQRTFEGQVHQRKHRRRLGLAVLDHLEIIIRKVCDDFPAMIADDGMEFDKHGNLYMSDMEKNAITKLSPKLEKTVLTTDARLL